MNWHAKRRVEIIDRNDVSFEVMKKPNVIISFVISCPFFICNEIFLFTTLDEYQMEMFILQTITSVLLFSLSRRIKNCDAFEKPQSANISPKWRWKLSNRSIPPRSLSACVSMKIDAIVSEPLPHIFIHFIMSLKFNFSAAPRVEKTMIIYFHMQSNWF